MLAKGTPELKNEYTRLVRQNGNPAALALMDKVFCPCASDWRGLGQIPGSGYKIREEYAKWDAVKKFSLTPAEAKEIPRLPLRPDHTRRHAADRVPAVQKSLLSG